MANEDRTGIMSLAGGNGMDSNKENILRIDPETGAVIINDSTRIEPGWTMAEFVQSDVYKTYVHDGSSERTKVLLLKNVAGKDISFSVMSIGTKVIKDIKIEIFHPGVEKPAEADKTDFLPEQTESR